MEADMKYYNQCEEVDENLELRIHFISTTKPFKRNINGVYKSWYLLSVLNKGKKLDNIVSGTLIALPVSLLNFFDVSIKKFKRVL